MNILDKVRSAGMLAGLAQVNTTPPPIPPINPIPTPNITELGPLVAQIIGFMLILAGIIAVIYLIYGGYQYLTAGGDPERATKAKTTIINAIIGIIIIALSFAIYNAVRSVLLRAG